jgi:zinc transport system substrate-binding protein
MLLVLSMNKVKATIVALALVLLFSGMAQAGQVSQPKVVLVSVHPMALLIKSAWPELSVSSLVSANQSPHDFVLKPSDMTHIASVDAVIWMGPEFEPYLKKAIKGKVQINLSPEPLVEHKADAAHEDHSGHDTHDHEEVGHKIEQHEESAHSDHVHDPHLWLDPNRILEMVTVVQTQLGLPEPKAFISEYQAWKSKAHVVLKDHQKIGFVSFHDAFNGWIKVFNLNQLAVVTSNPEKPVGTRHIVEVRNVLASGQAQCLFVEPQFQSRIVSKLHKGLDIKVIKVDPMASAYSIDSGRFIDFHQELLSNFTQCFSK